MKIKIVFLVAVLLAVNYLPVNAAPFAYAPNEKSGTVSVICTANDQVVAEIKAGEKLRGLAASFPVLPPPARGGRRI